MFNTLKKSIITLACIGIFASSLAFPLAASAQTMTVASLQAEIASLLQEVQTLQVQLNSQQANSPAATTVSTGSYVSTGSATSCYTFTRSLGRGTTGADVSALQSMLTTNGFPVSVSGFFGNDTFNAVSTFQTKYVSDVLAPANLTVSTGYAGNLTLAKLESLANCPVTVGAQTNTTTIATPPSTTNPISIIVPQTMPAGDGTTGNPQITSLSTAVNGMSVTLTVTATDPSNLPLSYTFNWDDGSPVVSTQSTSYTHTYVANGTHTVTVTAVNTAGKSSMYKTSVTVMNTVVYIPPTITTLPIVVVNNCQGIAGTNGQCISSTSVSPVISSLSPTSGPVGTVVTITGTGFTATGNTVNFNGSPSSVIPNLTSSNGTLTFTVPAYYTPACSFATVRCPYAIVQTAPGTYSVFVTNDNGTSNVVTFTVTSSTNTPSSSTSVSPVITALSPTSGPVGTVVTITGTGFTSTGNTVLFGTGSLGQYTSSDGRTLTISIPSSVGPNCSAGKICPTYATVLNTPGTYNMSVANTNGTSNTLTFTVTSSGFVCPNNAMCATPLN